MHPAAVATMTMKTEDVPFTIELPATLSGSKEVEVRARVTGILESRNFEEGQRVNKANHYSLLILNLINLRLTALKQHLMAQEQL